MSLAGEETRAPTSVLSAIRHVFALVSARMPGYLSHESVFWSQMRPGAAREGRKRPAGQNVVEGSPGEGPPSTGSPSQRARVPRSGRSSGGQGPDRGGWRASPARSPRAGREQAPALAPISPSGLPEHVVISDKDDTYKYSMPYRLRAGRPYPPFVRRRRALGPGCRPTCRVRPSSQLTTGFQGSQPGSFGMYTSSFVISFLLSSQERSPTKQHG